MNACYNEGRLRIVDDNDALEVARLNYRIKKAIGNCLR